MPGAVDKSFEPTHEQVMIILSSLFLENINNFYVNFKTFHLI